MLEVLSLEQISQLEQALLLGRLKIFTADDWSLVQAAWKQIRLWAGRKERKREAKGSSTKEYHLCKTELERGKSVDLTFAGGGRVRIMIPDFLLADDAMRVGKGREPSQSTCAESPPRLEDLGDSE